MRQRQQHLHRESGWERGHSGYDDDSSFHSDLDAVRPDCLLEHRISRPPNPVFCTNKYNVPCSDLRVTNTDGTGDTELLASNWTNSSEVSLFNISAHVTPDGATVIFGSGPYDGGSWSGTGLQLCSIPLATGNVTQTPTLLSMATGAASSDPNIGLLKIGGQHQVVFSSIRPTISAGNLNVFSMNADGTGVTQLTRFVEPLEGQDAGWSPDMSMISFEQDTKGGAANLAFG